MGTNLERIDANSNKKYFIEKQQFEKSKVYALNGLEKAKEINYIFYFN